MPTLEQHMAALARAERAGDTEAANYIRQRAQAEITGPGSTMAKIGAGMQDLVTGTKQAFGQADIDDVREHERIAEAATGGTLGGRLTRGLGTAALAAPAMFIPGANTVAGAGLTGAAIGALSPTSDENVLEGKLKNAAIGGATGGLAQKGLNVALPAAGKVLQKTLGGVGDYAKRFSQGGRQGLAEEAFASAIPAAERPAAQQALAGAAVPGGSGAPVTSGVATRNPALLEAERQAREAGGALGHPIEDLYERAAQSRWGHLQQNVGGDVPRLSGAAEDVYDSFMSGAKMQRPFDSKRVLGQEIQGAIDTTHNKTVQTELARILEQYKSARRAGDIGSLHELRMTALDDALSRLYQSDKKAAGLLRNRIEGFKETFDAEMNRALGGTKWSQFLDDYGVAAGARNQARSGNELLAGMENLNQTPGGVPRLTGQERRLATAASAVDDYGRPVYSPQGQRALGTVRQEVADQNLPYTLGPRGTATAQNLAPQSTVLARARQAMEDQKMPLWRDPILAIGATADMVGGHGLGTGIALPAALARRGLISAYDRQALDIAQRLIQLHVDPGRAAQALQSMNIPPQVKQSVMRAIASRATQAAPQFGAATMTQNR